MPTPIVYVTTWCKDIQLLYGSTLVFETIRVGFPNSEIVVIENASIESARNAIFEAARGTQCQIRALDDELPHWKIIQSLCLSEQRPFVILDPDIALWQSVEDWEFGGALMAGRFIPSNAPSNRLYNIPRLHSSHLWFPDPVRLRERISFVTGGRSSTANLFRGGRLPCGLFWDTADILYTALDAATAAFTEAQLDCYDHLFAGSYLPALQANSPRDIGDAVAAWHMAAKSDYRSLKGSWRRQQELLDTMPWKLSMAERPWRSEVLDYALRSRWFGRLRRRLLGEAYSGTRALTQDLELPA